MFSLHYLIPTRENTVLWYFFASLFNFNKGKHRTLILSLYTHTLPLQVLGIRVSGLGFRRCGPDLIYIFYFFKGDAVQLTFTFFSTLCLYLSLTQTHRHRHRHRHIPRYRYRHAHVYIHTHTLHYTHQPNPIPQLTHPSHPTTLPPSHPPTRTHLVSRNSKVGACEDQTSVKRDLL